MTELDKATKFLLTGSAFFFVSALFWHFAGKHVPWARIPWGRLPGDIVIKGENSSFSFPIVTCLLLSLVLSLLLRLFR